jgi:phage tail sheath gpL-like
MTILTGVPATSRVPQTFHKIIYQAGSSLVPLAVRSLLIGVAKGGTSVAGTVYQIDDINQVEGLFGVGSELTLMCKMAFSTCALFGKGPVILACPVAENAAGTAGIFTLTIAGTATETSNLVVRIAGRTITIPVLLGDVAATVATNANIQINAAKNNLPLTSTVAAAVVTATMNIKGDWGSDVKTTVVTQPAGITATWANPTPGVGVNDPTAALAAALAADYDTIPMANHKAADVTLAIAHVTSAWGAAEKKFRWVIFGENGTLGTATTLAAPANDKAVTFYSQYNSPSLPSEMAVAYAMAVSSRSRPNANWDGLSIPIYPAPEADNYTGTMQETALAAGLTPGVASIVNGVAQQGVSKIVKAVTSQITLSGQPFEVTRDLAVPRASAYVARQLDAAYASQFNADAYPDGVLMDDDAIPKIRDTCSTVLYSCADFKVATNVDNDLQLLKVEKDLSSPGRVNVDITYTVIIGLHQVAFVHRVKI